MQQLTIVLAQMLQETMLKNFKPINRLFLEIIVRYYVWQRQYAKIISTK